MSVLSTIVNLNNSCSGIGLAGHVNVETGSLEMSAGLSPGRCNACLSYSGFARDCDACGRHPGNNLSFLAGLGDGVYPTFCFFRESGSALLGAVWIFDEGNKLANTTASVLNEGGANTDFLREFILPGLDDYQDLRGMIVGEIDATESYVSIQDPCWKPGDDAVLGLPFSGGARYSLAVFFEPASSSPTATVFLRAGGGEESITGGFEGSVRPRVAILIETTRVNEVLKLDSESELNNHDWDAQFLAWEKAFQYSNVHGNGAHCAKFNGLLWTSIVQRQESLGGPIPDVYISEALGWNIQSALNGDESAREQVNSLYLRYLERINEDMLSEICSVRGFLWDEEIRGLFSYNAQNSGAELAGVNETTMLEKFCTSCGRQFADHQNFCANCGGRRN